MLPKVSQACNKKDIGAGHFLNKFVSKYINSVAFSTLGYIKYRIFQLQNA